MGQIGGERLKHSETFLFYSTAETTRRRLKSILGFFIGIEELGKRWC